jgi:hypothetical protein
LLKSLGISPQKVTAADKDAAGAIAVRFGGLPHALNHVAGYIMQKRLVLHSFLGVYHGNGEEIEGEKLRLTTGGYDHSLSSVWEATLTQISGDARNLLCALAYFAPYSIQERILVRGGSEILGESCNFLRDEIGLANAEEALLRTGMISIDESRVISIHPLVQDVVRRHVSWHERQQYFSVAVRIMGASFFDRWTEDCSHQFALWDRCADGLPHVQHLSRELNKGNIPRCVERQEVGEVFLGAGW